MRIFQAISPTILQTGVRPLIFVVMALAGCEPEPEATFNPLVEDLFLLDFAEAPELPEFLFRISARQDASLYAVAASPEPNAILLFDRSGRFIRGLSSRGSGPGELQGVEALAFDAGDSLWVVGRRTIDVWSPELQFVRSVPNPVAIIRDVNAATPQEGLFLVGTNASQRSFRAHWVSHRGVSPLPELENKLIIFGDPASENRTIVGTEEGYWIADYHEFDLRHVSFTGDTLARINRSPDWWLPGDFGPEVRELMATSPFILDIGLDERNQVWVLSGLPSPDPQGLDALKNGRLDAQVAASLMDHVLQVYDPSGTALLAEQRLDYNPMKFLNSRLAATALPSGDSLVVAIQAFSSPE